MKNFCILTNALDYIEQNVCNEIDSQQIADYCHVSLSCLQKLFRLALHRSIKEYVLKRRVCLAAKDILQTEESLIEIAYKYQFGSPENFTRVFKKVWNETPSDYRKHWKFSGIFPRINYIFQEGADEDMARKNVDISEAYDVFRKMEGTYVICFDLVGLVPINDISHEAGDAAIIEMAKRIDEVGTEEMMQLRIGGDEFALVTGMEREEDAQKLAEQVMKKNGECIQWKDKKIPIAVRYGLTVVPASLKYNQLFVEMHKAINNSRSLEN